MKTDFTKDFPEPASLQEAEDRRMLLIAELNDMQAQLSYRNREIDGRRMTVDEYWTWRDKAVRAQSIKMTRAALLKKWLKDHRLIYNAKNIGVDTTKPETVVLAAYNLLTKLRVEGLDLEDDELVVYDTVRDWLIHNGVKT